MWDKEHTDNPDTKTLTIADICTVYESGIYVGAKQSKTAETCNSALAAILIKYISGNNTEQKDLQKVVQEYSSEYLNSLY